MNILNSFSKWCNDNQGVLTFISILIVLATLIFSWKITILVALVLLVLFGSTQISKLEKTLAESPKAEPTKTTLAHITKPGTLSKNPNKQPSAKTDPTTIIKYVNSQPPYLQSKTEESYIGLRVDWDLEYNTLLNGKNGNARLMFRWPGSYPWVYCNIKLDDYPEFKSMKSKTTVNIQGVIKSVRGHDIELKSINITFTS